MNISEPGLTPHICLVCGKTYHALSGSRVYCPKCRIWLKSDETGTPASGDQESKSKPIQAKPFHKCERCRVTFRANSNREKYCKKCKPLIKREQGRNRIHKFRSKIVPCNALDTI